jgi:hypothetical protein
MKPSQVCEREPLVDVVGLPHPSAYPRDRDPSDDRQQRQRQQRASDRLEEVGCGVHGGLDRQAGADKGNNA